MDRAHAWIHRNTRTQDPIEAMPALIAEWCFHGTRGDAAGHLPAFVRRWHRSARDINPGKVSRADPLLTVAVESILKIHGLNAPAISDAAAFILAKAEDLALRAPASAAVAALGEGGWLPKSASMSLKPYVGLNFWSHRATIEDIGTRTSALVRFGRRPNALNPQQRENLAMVLTARMELAFRHYDLGLGMGLLRALQDLGCGSFRPTLHALDFLMRQQRPDGRVGFFQPTENAGNVRRPAPIGSDLALTATSGAMWTWAEAISPRFRLLLSLGPNGIPANGTRRYAQMNRGVHPHDALSSAGI